jgi:catechol 2,3-dioxygenase-like lactoylglutathione lyase family enzyme
VSTKQALFRKLDNHLLRVADLDAAITFYGDKLGHRLLWRSDEAAGFALPETDAELVVHLNIGPETDILVDDADDAFAPCAQVGWPFSRHLISESVDARVFATRSATNW